jgi:anti-sigma regulatory factor (Ser/Thr protein kinase)
MVRNRRNERIPGWASDRSLAVEGAPRAGLRHEAWLYSGTEEFVSGSLAFVTEGLEAGEDVMVGTTPANLVALKDEVADDGGLVFVDMAEAGRNPGRILSLWREFAARAEARSRPARGIGEPVWPQRTADELEECMRHEALINSAFSPDADFWLLCPYDRAVLDDLTLAAAERTHPTLYDDGIARPSDAFDRELATRALDGGLPSPPAAVERRDFEAGTLRELRAFARGAALRAGLAPDRADDLVFAVNELAANAIRHGGGRGTLTAWRASPDLMICEVTDEGRIRDPLVGRLKPSAEALGGRGLWIVHELCDLVQVRSTDAGTTVRVALALTAETRNPPA